MVPKWIPALINHYKHLVTLIHGLQGCQKEGILCECKVKVYASHNAIQKKKSFLGHPVNWYIQGDSFDCASGTGWL